MTPNELAHALDELHEYLLDAAPHLRMLRVDAQTLRELAHALDELREYLIDAVPHLRMLRAAARTLRELTPPDQTVRMKNLERVARSFIDDVEWQGASHNEEAYRQRAIAKHLLGDVEMKENV